MKFIDFFSGMGTARMGFEKAGHECVYSVEWDKHKRRIYGVIFGKEPEGRDIRDVRADKLPRADCWIAGFPCQDISVAGNQLGFDGDRSSLYFEIMRLLQETPEEDKPSYLLFENVKNFFSVNGGRDFLTALIAMDEVGYDAEWDLLNSKDFGVPQNRERVFIAGHLRGRSTGKVFPITEDEGLFDSKERTNKGRTQAQYCATTLMKSASMKSDSTYIEVKQIGNIIPTATRDNPNQGRVYDTEGLAPCLNKMEGGGREPFIEIKIIDDTQGFDGIREYTEYAPTLRSQRSGLKIVTTQDRYDVAILTPKRTEYGKKVRKQYESGEIEESRHNMTQLEPRTDGISNTLTTVQKDNLLIDVSRIRRLTPRECMRLQGVDDKVTDKLIEAGISDTQLYRAAGDAWSVPVGYEIARRMVC